MSGYETATGGGAGQLSYGPPLVILMKRYRLRSRWPPRVMNLSVHTDRGIYGYPVLFHHPVAVHLSSICMTQPKRTVLLLLLLLVIMISVAVRFLQTPLLIWNTTPSLPKGLYRIHAGYEVGDIVAFDIPQNILPLVLTSCMHCGNSKFCVNRSNQRSDRVRLYLTNTCVRTSAARHQHR